MSCEVLDRIGPERLELLRDFEVGNGVIVRQWPRLLEASALFGQISDPSEGPWIEATASFVASAEFDDVSPEKAAHEALPLILGAVSEFMPEQTATDQAKTVRHTMDWEGVDKNLKAKLGGEEQESQLSEWLISRASGCIETTYAGPESKNSLHFIVGGANMQGILRSALALASMASDEFRQEKGMQTLDDYGLDGEDGMQAGWLKDFAVLEELREHVTSRIKNGEIDPTIVIGASIDQKRKLRQGKVDKKTRKFKPAEREAVSGFLVEGVEVIRPELGLTEADAMLAGALRVFGGDPDSIVLNGSRGGDGSRIVTFQSPLGEISLIATTGDNAKISGQISELNRLKPSSFDEIDGVYGYTTAHYTWIQQATLEEAVDRVMPDADDGFCVRALGLSAHSAGIKRNNAQLVGEMVNYMKALHGIATRTVESAVEYTDDDAKRARNLGLLARI